MSAYQVTLDGPFAFDNDAIAKVYAQLTGEDIKVSNHIDYDFFIPLSTDGLYSVMMNIQTALLDVHSDPTMDEEDFLDIVYIDVKPA